MKGNLEDYLDSLLITNMSFDDYIDLDKVRKYFDKEKERLKILNQLLGLKDRNDFFKKVEKIYTLHGDNVFKVLENLVAKRITLDSERIYYDSRKNEVLSYNLNSLKDINMFLIETKLFDIFKSIKSIEDYFIGIEIGLDSNARKNRSGKFGELKVRKILENKKIEFYEQKKLSDFMETAELIEKKIETKKVDFIFELNNKKYFVETSYYNKGGSKISETLKSYVNLSNNFDNMENIFIWIADGQGIMTIKKMLSEQWKNLNIMSYSQFDDFVKGK